MQRCVKTRLSDRKRVGIQVSPSNALVGSPYAKMFWSVPRQSRHATKYFAGLKVQLCLYFCGKKNTESWLPAIFALDFHRLPLWDPFDFSMLNVWKVGKQCKPTEKKRLLRQYLKHIYIIIKSVCIFKVRKPWVKNKISMSISEFDSMLFPHTLY